MGRKRKDTKVSCAYAGCGKPIEQTQPNRVTPIGYCHLECYPLLEKQLQEKKAEEDRRQILRYTRLTDLLGGTTPTSQEAVYPFLSKLASLVINFEATRDKTAYLMAATLIENNPFPEINIDFITNYLNRLALNYAFK